MPKIKFFFATLVFLFLFSTFAMAQEMPFTYGFLELIDYKNESVADASVRLLNRGSYENLLTTQPLGKTDQKGMFQMRVHYSNPEMVFSINNTSDSFLILKSQ